jgi:hypothetical protein
MPSRVITLAGVATDGGAAEVGSVAELEERAFLRSGDALAQFRATLREGDEDDAISDEEFSAWLAGANSRPAFRCVRRFAAVEGDTESRDLKGLGRISVKGFPRIGGVLHKSVSKERVATVAIKALVERTVQASYLTSLLILLLDTGSLPNAVQDDVDALWDEWIPHSYDTPAAHMDQVFNVVAFTSFWTSGLDALGLARLTKDLQKPKSDLNRSLGGLAGVGSSLALVERGFTRRPT